MNSAGNTSEEQQAANDTNPESVAAMQKKKSEREETRSFLNSLPEVSKPKPKRSVIEEHLDFLNSLPQVPISKASPINFERTDSTVISESLSHLQKEEIQLQALREESIRLEQDAELTKLIERKNAEELEKRIAMELEEPSANQSAYLNSKLNSDSPEKITVR